MPEKTVEERLDRLENLVRALGCAFTYDLMYRAHSDIVVVEQLIDALNREVRAAGDRGEGAFGMALLSIIGDIENVRKIMSEP